MDPRLLRPKASGGSPEADPPVQLKSEDNAILLTEAGEELTTE
jgi:hypothetical protein